MPETTVEHAHDSGGLTLTISIRFDLSETAEVTAAGAMSFTGAFAVPTSPAGLDTSTNGERPYVDNGEPRVVHITGTSFYALEQAQLPGWADYIVDLKDHGRGERADFGQLNSDQVARLMEMLDTLAISGDIDAKQRAAILKDRTRITDQQHMAVLADV